MNAKNCIAFMRLVDINKKIMKLPSPKAHIDILQTLNEGHKYTLITAARGFSKTTLVCVVWLCNFILTSKKDEYVLIVSNSSAKAKAILSSIKGAMDMIYAAGIRFKKLRWAQSVEFINENGVKIFMESRSVTQDVRGEQKDFLRPSLIICDDIESKAISSAFNTKTVSGRNKIKDFFYSDLSPSLSEDGRIIVVGTILHKDSLIANLMLNSSWRKVVIPICKDGESQWKTKFPMTKEEAALINENKSGIDLVESIEGIKERWFNEGKHSEFYQEYLCAPVADEKKIFDPFDFLYFDGLVWGDNVSFKIQDAISERILLIKKPLFVRFRNEEIPIGKFQIKATMDPASDGNDESTIIVCGMFENSLFVLDVLGGHWSPFDKVCAVLEVMKTYSPVCFGIEKAGMQNDFFYTAKVAMEQYQTYVPLVALSHGGKAKNIRIAALEPYFKTGRIYFNQSCSRIEKIETELLDFDIDTEAKKDNYIDALAYVLQIFFNIGSHQEQNKNYDKVIRGYEYY